MTELNGFYDAVLDAAAQWTGRFNPRAFDGRGSFSMGLTEQIVFPEIDYDKIDKIRGMNISVTTTAKTDAEALELLKAFNFPFRN